MTTALPAQFLLSQSPSVNPVIAQQMQFARLQQHAIQRQQIKVIVFYFYKLEDGEFES